MSVDAGTARPNPEAPSVAAFCAEHPSVAAIATCVRCGNFVCEGCANANVEETKLCERCVERAGATVSPRAIAALVLATCTFVGVVPGLVALVLSEAELRDVREGARPANGALYAKLARYVAWLELGAILVGAMVYLAQRIE